VRDIFCRDDEKRGDTKVKNTTREQRWRRVREDMSHPNMVGCRLVQAVVDSSELYIRAGCGRTRWERVG